jgi:predicted secreted protein
MVGEALESKPRYGRDASEIRVQVGVSFVLELSAIATAGYEWQLSQVPDVVVLSAERIKQAGPQKGAPATQEFEFLATRPGEGRLKLEYKRSWESKVTDRFELAVFVSQASTA